MRIPDPYAVRNKQPTDAIIFAGSQSAGTRPSQDDYFLTFSDECVVVADGFAGLPHGDTAAKLACETAIWGYKHIRQHRYYWLDKKLFMKRIFRSTNLAVWQKQREDGFAGGMATTLLVTMIGAKNYWIGAAGDTSVWFARDGNVTKLTADDVDTAGKLTKAVGFKRLGLVPSFFAGEFHVGDTLLIMTSGLSNYLLDQDISYAVSSGDITAEGLEAASARLIRAAEEQGATDNMTAVIIKRIPRTA
jgi:serine/threonine protein phosphatase PrpC